MAYTTPMEWYATGDLRGPGIPVASNIKELLCMIHPPLSLIEMGDLGWWQQAE